MGLNSKVFYLLSLYIFFCNLVCRTTFSLSHDEMVETECLKSIKTSLEDPLNRLTWTFEAITADSVCSFVGVTCWRLEYATTIKVYKIELRDMELKGPFPPGIKNCRHLEELDLSGNHFFGPIPHDIAKTLGSLSKLDLSHNSFSGEIPSGIADITDLNSLILDNNQLTGQIPGSIGRLQGLVQFSVSNNMLSGPVPDYFGNGITSKESYANNKGLCGGPLKPCGEHGLKFDYSFYAGFVLGYVVSVVIVITIFMSYVPWLHRKKMINSRTVRRHTKRSRANHISQLPHLRRKDKEIYQSEELVRRMDLADIRRATNNFSQDNIIGTGQIGTMYKATLSNGQFLAVKKLYYSRSLGDQFMFELKTLVKLRQQINIVELRGFCVESMERLLAYEYLSNGNLYDWLHSAEGEPSQYIEWPLRVKIATGVARALVSLHNNFGIGNLDISSKCILLDQNFQPKLSNFKQAKHWNPNDHSGSSEREFWQLHIIKEDVHNFGQLLLHLISGKEPSKIEKFSNSFERITHLSESSFMFPDPDDAIDKSLTGRGFDGEIFHFLRVACQCVQQSPDQRPTMLQVYKKLCCVAESYGLDTDETMIMPGEISIASTGDECVEVDEITEVPY